MKSPEKKLVTRCYMANTCLKRKAELGFTFLELVLVISIISVLFVVAVDKLLALRVDAERTAMQQVLGSLRSAMSIDMASKIARNNIEAIAEAEGENPMLWLSERPENYIGVKNEADPADIAPGKWYFDQYYGFLIYRVNNVEYYESSQKNPPIARFRVELDYTDANDDGEYSAGIDEIHGLRLAAVEPYKWLNEPVTVEDYTQ